MIPELSNRNIIWIYFCRKLTQLCFKVSPIGLMHVSKWSTYHHYFDMILQISLRCICWLERQVTGNVHWFHKWHQFELIMCFRLNQNISFIFINLHSSLCFINYMFIMFYKLNVSVIYKIKCIYGLCTCRYLVNPMSKEF